ncbi:MAG TPA: protein kinase, partial [Polyangiaceae bacterium]|nr:protein kinase [Polyangiaceae bacterium]
MGGQAHDCPDTDVLAAFVAGTLDAEALAGIERHLAVCDHCLAIAAHAAHGVPPSEPAADASASRLPAGFADADRFVLGALIATGGMGAVYHGLDRHTGRPVAIKRLHAHGAGRQHKGLARFLREVEILSRLDHPNIIKHVAAVQRADQVDLVMEYAPGGSLRDVLD